MNSKIRNTTSIFLAVLIIISSDFTSIFAGHLCSMDRVIEQEHKMSCCLKACYDERGNEVMFSANDDCCRIIETNSLKINSRLPELTQSTTKLFYLIRTVGISAVTTQTLYFSNDSFHSIHNNKLYLSFSTFPI